MKQFFKSDAGVYLISMIGAAIVWLLNRTSRVQKINKTVLDDLLAQAQSPIFLVWHDQLMIFPSVLTSGIPASGLCSPHSDGRMIGLMLERFGYHAVWGSSNRQPAAGLRAMAKDVRKGHVAFITPDGPRGPAQKMAPGPVSLAQLTGAPIVPVSWRGTRMWRANGWDRMRFMKPFSKIFLVYGTPIYLPRTRDEGALEDQRLQVEAALKAVNAQAQSWIGGDDC